MLPECSWKKIYISFLLFTEIILEIIVINGVEWSDVIRSTKHFDNHFHSVRIPFNPKL